MAQQPIIIFHCEFSQKRAPSLYSILRKIDRKLNYAIYPKVCFPEMYLIKDGFSSFSSSHPSFIEGRYLKMADVKTSMAGEGFTGHNKKKVNQMLAANY